MKKIILLLFALYSVTTFSQETYIYKGKGNVADSKGETISPDKMRSLLSDNVKALELYNAGRSKKTVGNVLLYGSVVPISLFMRDFIRGHNGEIVGYQNFPYGGRLPIYGEPSIIPAIIGGAMIITAIPIKIGFSNKIKKVVDLMNENPQKSVGFIESSSIIINQNGVGIALKF